MHERVKQSHTPRNGNVDRNRRNRLSALSPKNGNEMKKIQVRFGRKDMYDTRCFTAAAFIFYCTACERLTSAQLLISHRTGVVFFVFRSSGLHFIAFHGEIHSRDVRPLVRPRCNYIICDWLWHIPSSLHTVAQELTTKADSDLSVIYKCCFATSDIYPINSHYWAFPDTSRFSPALQCWFLADRRLLSMVALMLIWSNSESVKSAIYAQVFKIVLSFWKFAYE